MKYGTVSEYFSNTQWQLAFSGEVRRHLYAILHSMGESKEPEHTCSYVLTRGDVRLKVSDHLCSCWSKQFTYSVDRQTDYLYWCRNWIWKEKLVFLPLTYTHWDNGSLLKWELKLQLLKYRTESSIPGWQQVGCGIWRLFKMSMRREWSRPKVEGLCETRHRSYTHNKTTALSLNYMLHVIFVVAVLLFCCVCVLVGVSDLY